MSYNELVTVVAIVTFVFILVFVGVNDRKRRRKDGSVLSGIVGTFDEAFHPEAARASEIREVQRELPAEAPTPGDPIHPHSTIVISLPER